MTLHPRPKTDGTPVVIDHPTLPSGLTQWADPLSVGCVVPDGPMPEEANGIPFLHWATAPQDRAGWSRLTSMSQFEEPEFEPMGLQPAAGAVIVEPDGRVWLVAPTNKFGGYKITFPKGRVNHLNMRETAMKEVFEETGLHVELFQHLIDTSRSTTRTRYYLARRLGGCPADMAWESQAVLLAPLEGLREILNKVVDHEIVAALEEKIGDWVWWFNSPSKRPRDLDEARREKIPARKDHWVALPLPKTRTRISLDLRLSATEAVHIKRGFVPRDMDEKWFVFYQDGVLHEHRSWTGICIDQVHFEPEGEGLRAAYAEVNRYPVQYSCQDDLQDKQEIEDRIRNLSAGSIDLRQ